MSTLRFVRRALLFVLVAAVLYAVLGSLLPNWRQKTVSEESLAQLADVEAFSPEADGRYGYRAALIEAPQDAFAVRVAMIREAKSSIELVCHGISEGLCSDAILSELIKAAQRGVRVRVVVDAKVGAKDSIADSLDAMASMENIEVYGYNPFKLFAPQTWHALLHDKILLCDSTGVLIGGRNIGDRYFAPDGYSGEVTYDRDVYVSAPAADSPIMRDTAAYIHELITYSTVRAGTGEELDAAAPRLEAGARKLMLQSPGLFDKILADFDAAAVPARDVRLITNPAVNTKKEPLLAWQLIDIAKSASSEVVIQTPYSTANGVLLEALTAVGSGPRDALYLTNSMASAANFPAFSDYHYNRDDMLETGLDIYEYQGPGSIHAKSLVADGRISAVGSFNFDDRSMYLDTESMLVIDSEELAQQLRAAMQSRLDRALQVGTDNEYIENESLTPSPVPAFKRVMMAVSSVFVRMIRCLV